jgi:hypothetical protein
MIYATACLLTSCLVGHFCPTTRPDTCTTAGSQRLCLYCYHGEQAMNLHLIDSTHSEAVQLPMHFEAGKYPLLAYPKKQEIIGGTE